MEARERGPVCVTGAAGFIASWIVKLLLDSGYSVKGTVRDLSDASHIKHLLNLPGSNRLTLVEADILDMESVLKATSCCTAVIHTACPVQREFKNPLTDVVKPAVEGTVCVMEAACRNGVKKVIMTSSIGTVYLNPERNRTRNLPLDESCWSDTQHLVDTREWYCLAKTLAEKAAWECAGGRIELVTIIPPVVLGPVLEPRLNASSMHLIKYLTGRVRTYTNLCQGYVDVRDVAMAHLLVLDSKSASGRYLCVDCVLHRGELVEAIAKICPEVAVITCANPDAPSAVPLRFCTQKIGRLGLSFRSFSECLEDSIQSYKTNGLLKM